MQRHCQVERWNFFKPLLSLINPTLQDLFWGQTRDPLRPDLGKTTGRRLGSADQQTGLSAFPRDGGASVFPRARRVRACPRAGGLSAFPQDANFSCNEYKSRELRPLNLTYFTLLRLYADHIRFHLAVCGSNLLPDKPFRPLYHFSH